MYNKAHFDLLDSTAIMTRRQKTRRDMFQYFMNVTNLLYQMKFSLYMYLFLYYLLFFYRLFHSKTLRRKNNWSFTIRKKNLKQFLLLQSVSPNCHAIILVYI